MKLASLRHVALGLIVVSFAGACRRPNADAHLQKATAYVDQSRLSDAIIEYRLALQADPKRGDIRLKFGDALLRSGDGSNALKEYVRAADLLPDDAKAQIKAGNILLMAGGFEDAKTRANKALALEPRNVDAQILLGNALAGLKNLDGAMADTQRPPRSTPIVKTPI
jgi:tetratricopeptide (TPR) repeat protein